MGVLASCWFAAGAILFFDALLSWVVKIINNSTKYSASWLLVSLNNKMKMNVFIYAQQWELSKRIQLMHAETLKLSIFTIKQCSSLTLSRMGNNFLHHSKMEEIIHFRNFIENQLNSRIWKKFSAIFPQKINQIYFQTWQVIKLETVLHFLAFRVCIETGSTLVYVFKLSIARLVNSAGLPSRHVLSRRHFFQCNYTKLLPSALF